MVASAVFLNQLYRQQTLDLSTWKGGGMGMFAAWDHPLRARFIRIYGITDDDLRLPIVESRGDIRKLKYRVKTEPTENNLNTLMRRLVNISWRYSDDLLSTYTQDDSGRRKFAGHAPKLSRRGGARKATLNAIEIEYGEIKYDTHTQTITPVIVRTFRHDY